MVDKVAQAQVELEEVLDLPVLIRAAGAPGALGADIAGARRAGRAAGSPAGKANARTEQLLERLARARNRLGRERLEAPALVSELLGRPPGDQEDLVRRDPRFQTWGVCELLLRRGDELAGRDAAESGRRAGLALATADLLSGRHPEPVLQDLRARAWATVGESRRQTGQLRGAEEALRSGAGCLAHGTGDLLVEARLLEFEAAVRLDQERRGEAAALLQQAASRYMAVNEPELLDRTLLRRNQIRREAERVRFASELAFEPSV